MKKGVEVIGVSYEESHVEKFLGRLRPGNESYEHYMLKQVGKAWLYDKGVRAIGTEVYVESERESPYGRKSIVDVAGVEHRRTNYHIPVERSMLLKWEVEDGLCGKTAELLQKYPESAYEALYGGDTSTGELLKMLMERDYGSVEGYITGRKRYIEDYTLYTIEAKASVSDFKNGFSIAGDYSYVIVPKGVIDKELVPSGVGLLEVDLDVIKEGGGYRKALENTKRVRKSIDGVYCNQDGNENVLYRNYKLREIEKEIGKRNVNEGYYWNPHLRVNG